MPKLVARDDAALLADYAVLLDRVQAAFALGQQRTEEIKLQAYWDAGRLIHEHLRHHPDKAGYGQQLFVKMANTLGVGRLLLYRMLQFYEAYPIVSSWKQLGWSHLRTLALVSDQKQRSTLETRSLREHWNAERLEKQVQGLTIGASRRRHPQPISTPLPLEAKRGQLGLYRIEFVGPGFAVDLGFTCNQPIVAQPAESWKRDSLVTLTPAGKPRLAPDASKAGLYAYAAEILSVVDGDTLWLRIWLTPSLWLKEKVRLRGIDCPELDTPEGKAAKRFVEAQVKQCSAITITTTKPDKWDRYLCDIFLRLAGGGEVFLNNLLLEHGHARRYDKVTQADWGG